MLKFTPGPWKVKVDQFGAHSIKAPDGKSVGSVLQKRAEVAANARLIAAAPEMLSMLHRLRDWSDLDSGHFHNNFDADLTALIMKAEGA